MGISGLFWRVLVETSCQPAVEFAQKKQCETSVSVSFWTLDRMTLNLRAGIMLNFTLLCSVIHCGCFPFSHSLFPQLWRNAFVLINRPSSTYFHLPGAEWKQSPEEELHHKPYTQPPTHLYTKYNLTDYSVLTACTKRSHWPHLMVPRVLRDSCVIIHSKGDRNRTELFECRSRTFQLELLTLWDESTAEAVRTAVEKCVSCLFWSHCVPKYP